MTMQPSARARMIDERTCFLGEGPLWHPDRETLFWFDIIGNRLLARGPEGLEEWQLGEHHSAAGIVDENTLLVASETGLWTFDIPTGRRSPVSKLEANLPDTRSNDGRADSQGGFWIGTMGKKAEAGRGAIYRYYEGELRPLVSGMTVPNAICFAPDGACAYFACTAQQKIHRQRLDAKGWPIGEAETFVDLAAEGLYPDGAVVDADAGVWNAQWGAGRVARYTPDGQFDIAIEIPGKNSTCPVFGGRDLETLYVTSAQEGLTSPGPDDGKLYAVQPDHAGLPPTRVRL